MPSHTFPREGPTALRNLPVFFRLVQGEREWQRMQGWDLEYCFPKEVCQGWNISGTVTYSRCYMHASVALPSPSLSGLLVKTFLCSVVSSLFSRSPFRILWVMYAFIQPNKIIHHPMRAGKTFVTCPCSCKGEGEKQWNGRNKEERNDLRDSRGTEWMRWHCCVIKSDECTCLRKSTFRLFSQYGCGRKSHIPFQCH